MMKSMELEDDDKIDHLVASPMLKSDYPYGLRIALTEKEFEKLGLDHTAAEVGGVVHGHFIGRVTSCSADKTEDGEHCRCEIQIEDLEIESEDEENEEKE
jgi:Major coat protein-like